MPRQSPTIQSKTTMIPSTSNNRLPVGIPLPNTQAKEAKPQHEVRASPHDSKKLPARPRPDSNNSRAALYREMDSVMCQQHRINGAVQKLANEIGSITERIDDRAKMPALIRLCVESKSKVRKRLLQANMEFNKLSKQQSELDSQLNLLALAHGPEVRDQVKNSFFTQLYSSLPTLQDELINLCNQKIK